MNLSGLGAGLGAVPGGFQQGQLANNQIEAGQLQNVEAQAKQIGMAAYFRALQGLTQGGGQGPQPPMPGQPSQPSPAPGPSSGGPAGPPAVMDRSGVAAPDAQGVYGQNAVMMPPGGQAPQPGMQSAPVAIPQQGPGGPSTPGVPPGPGGGLPMTWQGIAHSIKANNPGVDDLALAHAVDKFVPMMAAQSQAEWRNLRTEVMGQIADVKAQAWRDTAATRADAARDVAGTRADASRDVADTRADTASNQEQGRAIRSQRGYDLGVMRERGRQERFDVSDRTKREMSYLSADTRREIAQLQEGGRNQRAELSTDARREIAQMSIDARRELTDTLEAGRQQRFDTSEDRRRDEFETRTDLQREQEAGRNQRADLSATTRREIATLSDATRRELEQAREGGRNWRGVLSAASRRDIAQLSADARREIADMTEAGRQGRFDSAETGRQGRFDTAEDRRRDSMEMRDQQFQQREQRLQESLKLRGDSTWARLDQQKQQFEQRIRQGDRRQAVSEWRATVDAQHKYAMEKILSARDMKPAERQQMITDQNGWYTQQIERMKNLTSQQGNLTDNDSRVTGQSTENAPAGAQALPKAFTNDADGTSYQKNGQTWIKQGNRLILKPATPGPQSMSDEQPDPVRPGTQFAAMETRYPPNKLEFGVSGRGSSSTGSSSGRVIARDYGKERLENPEGNIWYATKPLEAIRQETRIDHLRTRLGQLTRDKAATKKTGYDVESSDYMHYNTMINAIRARLRELFGGQ